MDEETTQLEEALRNLPKEVRVFLYEGFFENTLTTLAQTHNFSEEQKNNFRAVLIMVICLLQPKDALIELFTSWGFTQEKQALLVKDIEEKIFIPIIEATNYIVEEDPEDVSTETAQGTKPDPYAELQKRFVYGTPIVRTEKKSYSLDKFPLPPRPKESGEQVSQTTNTDGALLPPPAPKQTLDPYREKPE